MDESEFPVDLDWLSEEKYNILKEKYTMARKKLKRKIRRRTRRKRRDNVN